MKISRKKRAQKALPLSPVDGVFVKSERERILWCIGAKHPLVFLNLSKSTAEYKVRTMPLRKA